MRRSIHVIIALSLTACASANSNANSESLSIRTSPARNVLTAAEIVASRVTDVYQAVTQLRPDFLRRRASNVSTMALGRPAAVAVYLDEIPYGGVESLKHIPLDRVRVIRYLNAFDADLRWGGSHPAGAILVVTMKAR